MILNTRWLTRVLLVLARLDEKHAQRVRAAGCPMCGGPLHAGHYVRAAWGWPRAVPREAPDVRLRIRWSLCCGRRGCRKRVTPESWRFHGRRFYVAPMVLALAAQATGVAVETSGWDGPCRRTVRRWLSWWQSVFAATGEWVSLRGRFERGLPATRLPGGLAGLVRRPSPLRLLMHGLSLVRPWTGGSTMVM